MFCLLFMLLAAMLMHCQLPNINRCISELWSFFAGKRFLFSSAPPPLIFHFSHSNFNEIAGLEMLAT